MGKGGAEERRLAILLLLLAAVSGLFDAASYLTLGHVFVANMTGNIVFSGFALAGASGFSLSSNLVAVAAFFIGAVVAGRLAQTRPFGKPGLLGLVATIELFLLLVGVAIAATGAPEKSWPALAIVALLAAAMGIQSVTTSRLQIGGFNSTVVLTTMLSTLAAASQLAGGNGKDNGRRILAISCMFGGGLIGAVLALRVSRLAPMALAGLLLLIAAASARAIASSANRTVA